MTDTNLNFKKAQQAHQQGNLAAAENLYQAVLQQNHKHGDSLQFMGLLQAQKGNLKGAISYLEEAVRVNPQNPVLWHNLGEAQRRLSQMHKALDSLNQALKLAPDFFEALYSRATVLGALERFEEAEAEYKNLLKKQPNNNKACSNLGAILIRTDHLDEARHWIQKAVSRGQKTAQNLTNLGVIFDQQKKHDQAKHFFQSALEVDPQFILARLNLGALLCQEKSFAAAKTHFQKVLSSSVHHEKAWLGLAEIEVQNGLIGTALDLLITGLKHLPQNPHLHHRLATLFQQVKEIKEASKHFQLTLQSQPDHLPALHGLAALNEKQGNLEAAFELYARLLQLRPECDLLRLHIDLLTPVLLQEDTDGPAHEEKILQILDQWQKKGLNFNLDDLAFFTGQSNFMHTYQTQGNGKRMREKMVALFRPHLQCYEPLPNLQEKPHIGFLITQGHEFIFAKSVCGILNHLSQEKYQITLFCNQLGFDKSIQPYLNNPEIKVVHIPGYVPDSAEIVHQAACDILNFWEISTDCQNFFLPFYRLAPIQTLSWGWPMTSGNSEVDYYLSSKHLETEDGDKNYTEALHRFSVLPTYYYRPEVPAIFKTREELGFSTDEHLYFCSQNLFKIQPDFDMVVQKILKADPQGRFLFFADKLPHVHKNMTERIQRHCPEVFDRIEFVARRPFAEYLNLVHIVDLVMDPFHYVGANTSYDAFAVETPVMTLPSDFHRGRHTYAAYQEMGILDAVATDPDDYVAKAVYFATHPQERKALGQRIVAACDILFENMQIVREYEAFFDEQLALLNNKA